VPPAYQQSRGATFRDSRLRRNLSHNTGELSRSSKSHPDDEEIYDEDNSDLHSSKQQGNVQRPGYERSSSSGHLQGISTIVKTRTEVKDTKIRRRRIIQTMDLTPKAYISNNLNITNHYLTRIKITLE
jgi:hypothetical protein